MSDNSPFGNFSFDRKQYEGWGISRKESFMDVRPNVSSIFTGHNSNKVMYICIFNLIVLLRF